MHNLGRIKMPTLRFFQLGMGTCLLVVLAVSVFMGSPAAAQSPEAPAAPEVPPTQVKALIRLLEDEPARTVFLQHLKSLAKLQAETTPAKPGTAQRGLSRLFREVEFAIQQTRKTSQDIFDWLTRVPQRSRELWASLRNPETERLWVRTLQHLAFSFGPAFLVLLALRQALRPLTRVTLLSRPWPIVQRLWQALLEVIVRVIPTVGFVMVAGVLVGLLDTTPAMQETVYFLLTVLLAYQAIAQCIWVSVAPESATSRLVPMADETATYLWEWARRFLFYGVGYALIMKALQGYYADPRTYQSVRALLLCVFPTLVTIFVARVARHRIRQPEVVSSEADARVFQTTRRVLHTLWPFLGAIYAWALTFFIISHHADGMNYLLWGSVKTILVILGLFLVLHLFNRLFDSAFRLGDRLRQRYSWFEQRANRYLKALRDVCHGLLVLLAMGVIFELWGVPTSWFLTSPLGTQLLARTLIIALAIGLTGIAMGISKAIADALLQTRIDANGLVHEPSRKRKTLVPLAYTVLKVALVFVAVLIVLEQLRINTGPILAGVGILGLAVGFGAQSLVKDVINGLFILFEDSLSVGDVVVLRGTGGLVEKVTLRTVTLRDLSGNVHVIPNSSIDMVTNMTKEYSCYVLDVCVAYREDIDEVMGILKEIDQEMRSDSEYCGDMLEPIEIMGLERFADSAVVVRARLKTRPIQQWRIGREFNRRMKRVFDERGIEIPFPHRTLYWGVPKQGVQEPIHVAMDDQQKVHSQD